MITNKKPTLEHHHFVTPKEQTPQAAPAPVEELKQEPKPAVEKAPKQTPKPEALKVKIAKPESSSNKVSVQPVEEHNAYANEATQDEPENKSEED